MQTALPLAAIGGAGAALVMGLAWLVYRRRRNAGVVDVGWTVAVTALAGFYALAGPGYAPRRAAIAAMTGLWGARLVWYLLRDRVVGRPEDGRYVDLRERRSPAAVGDFALFFLAQAPVALFFSTPALVAALNPAPRLSRLEIGAMALWLVAWLGEAVADRQLERFKARPESRGRTCREGLWRYSRHPNYFFEWLVWVAFALYAQASPWGAAAWACPAVMLFLLFRVTGIPATEAQAVRTRGDDYRRYQATTSVFVPWPPRSRA